MPLIEALRLRPESAQDVLTAWTGIAYFEYEYSALQPKLKEFAGWLGGSGQELARGQRLRGLADTSSMRRIASFPQRDRRDLVQAGRPMTPWYFRGDWSRSCGSSAMCEALLLADGRRPRAAGTGGARAEALPAQRLANRKLNHLALKELLFLIRELLLISG